MCRPLSAVTRHGTVEAERGPRQTVERAGDPVPERGGSAKIMRFEPANVVFFTDLSN